MSLSEKKGVWTSTEIVYESRQQGFKETTIRRAISNLVQSGKLTKVRRGEYEISNDQELLNS
ncbi:MAG: type IV toxin-antitoxin system AbiEi family antitoxin domain-containing protein [Candidatus Dadabacteria bacterium]|nr:type IV toxin-antitoxin system AbiEi family antitoxin domain-containing protein [Candidatus Dadabacteria bacterium]